jgi:two-component system OmpR family response regulator
VLLYGTHGIGKSTWASQAPKPIVLATEDGLNDVGVDRIEFYGRETIDLAKALIALSGEEEHGYKTVVIDSLDWLDGVCEDKVEAELDWDDHHVMVEVRFGRVDTGLRLWAVGMPMEKVNDYLDLGLPEIDGLTVLGMWRREGRTFPVLVLTARDSWSDKVAGLDAGADDYLAKPFQTEELIARLRALIRRASGNTSSELTAGDVRLDTRSGRVTLAGQPVKLTAQEYKLLSYLMHHKGKVVSRTELIEHIYDQDFDRDSNTIEVFVTRIRKKLGADVITTIRGLGYSLDDPAEAPRA